MSRSATRSSMSPDEYLAWEREQEGKHEFFHGEVFAISDLGAGASPRHNALCGRVIALASAGSPPSCVVLTSDQRVTITGAGSDQGATGGRYVYPDVSIVCSPLELESGDVLRNPTALVEVISQSTEQYDRGLKWEGYQRIPSLSDYVLVSQTEPRIEHYRRADDGSWVYRAAGPGQSVTLACGTTLPVDQLFAGVLTLPGD
ncbi:MAG: Uma2 family endonuclease [Myxococcales bacterium]|nr:Uma2 family endonuclease [Myxococcales bacterium]